MRRCRWDPPLNLLMAELEAHIVWSATHTERAVCPDEFAVWWLGRHRSQSAEPPMPSGGGAPRFHPHPQMCSRHSSQGHPYPSVTAGKLRVVLGVFVSVFVCPPTYQPSHRVPCDNPTLSRRPRLAAAVAPHLSEPRFRETALHFPAAPAASRERDGHVG